MTEIVHVPGLTPPPLEPGDTAFRVHFRESEEAEPVVLLQLYADGRLEIAGHELTPEQRWDVVRMLAPVLLARIDALENALRPFAHLAEAWEGPGLPAVPVQMCHLRAARSLLATPEPR